MGELRAQNILNSGDELRKDGGGSVKLGGNGVIVRGTPHGTALGGVGGHNLGNSVNDGFVVGEGVGVVGHGVSPVVVGCVCWVNSTRCTGDGIQKSLDVRGVAPRMLR